MKDKTSQHTESVATIREGRLYYLDWLRVMAILSVFFYHCDRFFDFRTYPIQSTARSLASTIHREFFQQWMMPLFFIISGAAVFYSLRSRRAGDFIRERTLRILIPLVLIGIFIIAPPQVYLERLMDGSFSGTFIEWYPHYFYGIYPLSGNFAFQGMHLWYLMDLFMFSLILLPVFLPFRKTGSSILSRISGLFERPWALLLLFLPLGVTALLADMMGIGFTRIMGGWNSLSYPLFFIYGYLLFSNDRIQETIKRYSAASIIAASILTILYLYLQFGVSSPDLSALARYNRDITNPGAGPSPISAGWIIISFLRGLLAWCWIIGLLGLGSRFLNFKNRFLAYANEAVLPFYILHQTILLIIGFYVIQWGMGVGTKYIIITTASFIIIISLYELLVRRLNVLRFLFGMKTTNPFYAIFRKKIVLTIVPVFYIGLIFFAVMVASRNQAPMPITYDPEKDIILDAGSITDRSSIGINLVNDNDASNGQAVEFSAGANIRAKSNPEVYFETRFSAPAGRYYVWLRGKSDKTNRADSVWLQVDDQIGTRKGALCAGNWLDTHPAGVYGWAGNSNRPIAIELKRDGDHTIRIQPRQIPHRIDQIWLSRSQLRIPNTFQPISGK